MDTSSVSRARQDLREIQATTEKVRTTLAYGGADTILMAWGGIWFLGFLASDLFVRGVIRPGFVVSMGAVWLVLVLGGVLFSIYWGIRYGRYLPDTGGARVGWFWFFLYAYIWLATPILGPFLDFGALSTPEGARHYAALATLVPMFAYVVMGLWTERYMLWIGLVVTALLFVGLYGIPNFFWLWMAFVGGGALFVPGLIMRRKNAERLSAMRDREPSHA